MRDFDIELAKKNHPVQTKNGQEVRIICYDRGSENIQGITYPIVGLVKVGDGLEKIVEYSYSGFAKTSGDSDLVMAPIKKEGWVNRYKVGVSNYIFATKEEAEAAKGNAVALGKYKETIKIIYHE